MAAVIGCVLEGLLSDCGHVEKPHSFREARTSAAEAGSDARAAVRDGQREVTAGAETGTITPKLRKRSLRETEEEEPEEDMKSVSVLPTLLLLVSVSFSDTRKGGAGFPQREECSRECPAACDVPGYKDWSRLGSHCIKYFETPLNFTDAEFSCRAKVCGGHLVSVDSHCFNEGLLAVVLKHNKKQPRIWMGGFEMFKSGKFVWTDGSVWNYTAWVSGQPSQRYNTTEDCVEMNWEQKGKWNDHSCNTAKSYVCAFKRQA
ncbi:lectin-like [Megalops cyprinoides]|uniref:lectin-like n=1 Tax=Megalops cyprinoides TaxID=118141 RepID=UPI00186423B7|nr:lectin-like [Megalops cyprinoides]